MPQGYATPEVLVNTGWMADHLRDPKVRVVESDEDILLYDVGHIEGAVRTDWQSELQDQLIRDYVNRERFEDLMAERGIANDTTVVFYGDKSNWWACYAFWTFKMFGHADCRVMDGGRQKWIEEERSLVKEVPKYPRTSYAASGPDYRHRAFREEVAEHVRQRNPLIDVRTPKEFTGELLHMENYPQEGALRGGHIPGAKSVPWSRAVREDGTFRPAEELRAIYEGEMGLQPGNDVIAYCRIGERSAHTWFVLHYLLGYPKVRNYDGSWTEWGNLVRAPIEKP